jgi:hypothetical protein
MSLADTLARIAGLLDSFETHRNYIDKAREQVASGRFAAAVVEKVILDHEVKSATIHDAVTPALPELHSAIAGFLAERDTIAAGKGGVDERVQELELRVVIGEMSEADFEHETGELRARLTEANERIMALEAEAQGVRAVMERWTALAARAGRSVAPMPEPAKVAPVAPVAAAPLAVSHVAPAPVEPVPEAAEPLTPAPVVAGAPSVTAEIDIGGLFDDPAPVAVPADEEVSVSLTSEPIEEDVVVDIDPPSVPSAPVVSDVDYGEVAVEEAEVPSVRPGDEFRRALLVLNENTEDERVYPFDGDEMWIGRSKDCQIQLKADPKVSRQHCRLHRRGNQFFIEDNGSTNSTLVNRELITERRLYGGEEVSVGESQFRFRIID